MYEFPQSPNNGDITEVSGVNYIYEDTSGWIINNEKFGTIKASFQYVASDGQSTFTGLDTKATTLSYEIGYVDVIVNGGKLLPTEFTATDGTSVIITGGVPEDTDVELVANGVFTVADHYTKAEIDELLAGKADV